MPSPFFLHPKGAPGSEQASANGCTCPVLGNGQGCGAGLDAGQPVFFITRRCPVHDNGVDTLAATVWPSPSVEGRRQ